MTAAPNTALTAAQWNTHVRDNLLTTAPGVASAAGQIFVATGANAIAARTPSFATVATSQTTTSTTYANLTTVGPQVTVDTGNSAIVIINSEIDHDSNSTAAMWASYEVTGATTIAANDTWALQRDGIAFGNPNRWGSIHMRNDLNPGSNVFTMKYRIVSATANAIFRNRHMVVIPL
jgi:hypothetical protein